MKKTLIASVCIAFCMLFYSSGFSQPVIDLSKDDQKDEKISVDVSTIKIINRLPQSTYKLIFKVEKLAGGLSIIEPFDFSALQGESADCEKCNKALNDEINKLFNAVDEKTLGDNITKLQKVLDDKKDACKISCLAKLNEKIKATITEEKITVKVENDQIITVIIIGLDNAGKATGTWIKKLTTPRTSRWLTHYGLSYAPDVISKTKKYYAKTDTSTANRYVITPQNNGTPKPWDNISATLNFTYPFSLKEKGFDLGFTAGFGLNPGLQLSGHAGFSAIIGTNVIIGTGVVLMQKYNLKGEYAKGQIIKENLAFESLHEKVWRPELYFTIGFRFNKNPFAGSTDKSSDAKSNATAYKATTDAGKDTDK